MVQISFLLVILATFDTLAQDTGFEFQVLSIKGRVLHNNNPIKARATLMAGDTLCVFPNAILGLVHRKTGKPLAIDKAGKYSVSRISAKPDPWMVAFSPFGSPKAPSPIQIVKPMGRLVLNDIPILLKWEDVADDSKYEVFRVVEKDTLSIGSSNRKLMVLPAPDTSVDHFSIFIKSPSAMASSTFEWVPTEAGILEKWKRLQEVKEPAKWLEMAQYVESQGYYLNAYYLYYQAWLHSDMDRVYTMQLGGIERRLIEDY